MRHPYAIGSWKTHLGAVGHKEGIISREEQKRREALCGNIPNDSEQQQLALAIYFSVKGTGSRFACPISKTKKRGRKETETSSGKSLEVAEVAVDAAAVGDATEL